MPNQRRQFLGLAADAIAVPANSNLMAAQGEPSKRRRYVAVSESRHRSCVWITTAWISEGGRLSFFFDRSRKSQSLSLPFRIDAVPLSKGQTQ
jgi:hypothetical protein